MVWLVFVQLALGSTYNKKAFGAATPKAWCNNQPGLSENISSGVREQSYHAELNKSFTAQSSVLASVA